MKSSRELDVVVHDYKPSIQEDPEFSASLSYTLSKTLSQKTKIKPGTEVYALNPRTWAPETGGSLWFPGQPGLDGIFHVSQSYTVWETTHELQLQYKTMDLIHHFTK